MHQCSTTAVCSCTFGTYFFFFFFLFHAITGSGTLCFGDLIIPANSLTASSVWVYRPSYFAVIVAGLIKQKLHISQVKLPVLYAPPPQV